jgi:hypothetical protein
VGECNPYLAAVVDDVEVAWPDATLVHLHRDPRAVLRSLLNRQWYDTPLDDWHPDIDVDGWDRMPQLERCAWYVRRTNERLLERQLPRISFEACTTDRGALTESFARLDVAFDSERAAQRFATPRNESVMWHVPPFERWSPEQRARATSVLDPISEILGYDAGSPTASPPVHVEDARVVGELVRTGPNRTRRARRVDVLGRGRWGALGVRARRLPLVGLGSGWRTVAGEWIAGTVEVAVEDGAALLLCVSFDGRGRTVHVRRVGRSFSDGVLSVGFTPVPGSARFNLVLAGSSARTRVGLRGAELWRIRGQVGLPELP